MSPSDAPALRPEASAALFSHSLVVETQTCITFGFRRSASEMVEIFSGADAKGHWFLCAGPVHREDFADVMPQCFQP